MKPNKTHIAALACVSLIASAAMSQAAVIIFEDFSYGDGGLSGQNGGTGFSNAWSSSTNVTGGVVTSTTDSTRDFTGNAFPSSGTIWISFDWGGTTAPTLDRSYGGLTFFEGATERFLIGNTWDSATVNQVWDMNGTAETTIQNSPGMKTAVARITLGTGATSIVDLWVAATGSPVDVSGAPVATTTGRDLDGVNRFRINGFDFTDDFSGSSGKTQSFDNLLVGTTMGDVDAIPEPSTALLGGLGLLALLRRRR